MADERQDSTKAFVESQLSIHGHLVNDRKSFEDFWSELAAVFAPELCDTTDYSVDGRQGLRFGADNYDGEPQLCLQKWSKGMVGNMVYDAPWFQMQLNVRSLMEEDDIRHYCQQRSEQVHYAVKRTNFHSETVMMAKYAGVVGGVLVPMRDEKRKRMHFFNEHPWCVWYELDMFGEVQRVHRTIKKTIRVWAETFGKENLPPEWRLAADDPTRNNEAKELLHITFPNPDFNPTVLAPEYQPYASVYLDAQSKHLVSRSGTTYLPIVWRVSKHPRWTYPLTPAMFALTDALTNDQLTMALLQAARRSADPRFLIHQNLRDQYSEEPGAKMWFSRPEELAHQMDTHIRWDVGDAQWERITEKLRWWFSVQYFTLLSSLEGPPPTAYHIQQVMGEKSTLLGPEVGSYEREVLDNVVDIVGAEEESLTGDTVPVPPQLVEFMLNQARNYAERNGLDMSEQDIEAFATGGNAASLDTEYTGVLAQVQKQMAHTRSYMDAIGMMQAGSELMPEMRYVMKPYEMGRGILRQTNIGQDELNSEEEYQAIIDNINQSAELQAQADREKAGAESYSKLTKAPEEGSPAEAA